MKLFNFLHKYFSFNKRERNGIVILLGIIIILIIIRIILPYFGKEDKLIITKLTPIEKDSFTTSNEHLKDTIISTATTKKDSNPTTGLIAFDPNTISLEEAKSIGFTSKIANTLIHFREKGGKFKQKEDLKKLYGISADFYLKLEPYIVIENTSTEKTKKTFESKSFNSSIKQIDINTADSIQFVSLPMIGPATAKKILRFRNALGGFYSLEQLKEVYGMKDSVYQLIQPRLTISSSALIKININTATYDDLKKHPYINHNMASTIVAYRKMHGAYKSTEDLKKVGTISDETLAKLSNYIVFE